MPFKTLFCTYGNDKCRILSHASQGVLYIFIMFMVTTKYKINSDSVLGVDLFSFRWLNAELLVKIFLSNRENYYTYCILRVK